MPSKDVTPEFYLIGLDTTQYWDVEIIAKAGRIVQVGISDRTQATHLCSLTPSAWVQMVTWFTTKQIEEDSETWWDIHLGCSQEEGEYYDYRGLWSTENPVFAEAKYLNDTPEEWQKRIESHDGDAEAAYEELVEEIIEYLQGNDCSGEVAEVLNLTFDYEEVGNE